MVNGTRLLPQRTPKSTWNPHLRHLSGPAGAVGPGCATIEKRAAAYRPAAAPLGLAPAGLTPAGATAPGGANRPTRPATPGRARAAPPCLALVSGLSVASRFGCGRRVPVGIAAGPPVHLYDERDAAHGLSLIHI